MALKVTAQKHELKLTASKVSTSGWQEIGRSGPFPTLVCRLGKTDDEVETVVV